MRRLLASLTCFIFCAPTFVSACSSDSDDPSTAQGGSAGSAGAERGGSGNQGGKTPGAGSTAGGSAGSGSNPGGTAGSNAGGSNAGGSNAGGSSAGGAAGSAGATTEAGSPGSEAGSGGGGAGDEVVTECLDAPVIDGVRTEALHFTGQGLELGIVRRADPDSVGTSGTTPWLPQRFALERGAVARCVSAVSDLDYASSHHNFDDEMRATVGAETWTFKEAREGYDEPTAWTVEGRNGNTLAWGPVTLTLLSCTQLDSGASCASNYQ